jgi:hypothetical protein
MRPWILAVITLAGLAVLLAVREVSLSKQIKTLRHDREELTVQLQSLIERLERAEENAVRQQEQVPTDTGLRSTLPATDNADLSVRVAALENQIRALNAKLNPEYDPTVAVPEPEPDTNGPAKRSWGPEQVLGPPDTERDADAVTAWTSLETDGGPEWLAVGFEREVEVAQVRVRESFNAGAITNVAALVNGNAVTLWEGRSARGKSPRDFLVRVPPGIRANSIIVYLDTQSVSGWNEIDAVELIGRDGSRQWATSARASSTYADRTAVTQPLDFQVFPR